MVYNFSTHHQKVCNSSEHSKIPEDLLYFEAFIQLTFCINTYVELADYWSETESKKEGKDEPSFPGNLLAVGEEQISEEDPEVNLPRKKYDVAELEKKFSIGGGIVDPTGRSYQWEELLNVIDETVARQLGTECSEAGGAVGPQFTPVTPLAIPLSGDLEAYQIHREISNVIWPQLPAQGGQITKQRPPIIEDPVSYTHLTLPTIYSV